MPEPKDETTATNTKKRYGMLIDLSLCVGCNACVVACKLENDTPLGKFNTWVESWDAGVYPQVARANLPKLCNHCADAPCVDACPYEATFADEAGIVVVDKEKCIGCGTCVSICPYGARYVDKEAQKCGKCTYCYGRSTNGLLPVCVASCITHARVFGDLDDPHSDIAQAVAAGSPLALRAELGFDTATRYLLLEETLEAPVCSEVFRGGYEK
ncbi:MAG: 4Fe-4S dicluster domain-containing protein [Coriobacteriaceae bacterium]|jgi:tetrathionate reductase subunit B|nr:4Fe-4S dicluster domain-containing protein [Coriobacteriaceae bacterium]